MRTAADLQDAFALLEQQADAWAGAPADRAHPPSGAVAGRPDARHRDASVLELVGRPAGPARRRRPLAAGLAAAACAAGLAVGAVVWTGSGGGSPAAGGRAAHGGRAPRSYDVTLDPALGLRLLEVDTAPDATGFEFYSRTEHVEVTLFPASARRRVTPGLERVALSGGRTGWYSDGRAPVLVEPGAGPGSPAATTTAPRARYARAVAVAVHPGRWLQVTFQGSIPTRAQLVRIADGLGLTRAARPVPSAVSLREAPGGLRLVALDSLVHEPGDDAPYDLTGRDWFTDLQYAPASGAGTGVAIQATSADLTSTRRAGAQPVTVGGHRGYWYPEDDELDLDLGQGRYLLVAGTAEGSATGHASRADLVAVARTVTVTAHPHEPARWFPATRALP